MSNNIKLLRLNQAAFEQLTACIDFQEGGNAISSTYEVLVNGKSKSDAAAEFGISSPLVGQAVKRIEEEFVKTGRTIDAIVRVQMDLPSSVVTSLVKLMSMLDGQNDEFVSAVAKLCAERVGDLASKIEHMPSMKKTGGD